MDREPCGPGPAPPQIDEAAVARAWEPRPFLMGDRVRVLRGCYEGRVGAIIGERDGGWHLNLWDGTRERFWFRHDNLEHDDPAPDDAERSTLNGETPGVRFDPREPEAVPCGFPHPDVDDDGEPERFAAALLDRLEGLVAEGLAGLDEADDRRTAAALGEIRGVVRMLLGPMEGSR